MLIIVDGFLLDTMVCLDIYYVKRAGQFILLGTPFNAYEDERVAYVSMPIGWLLVVWWKWQPIRPTNLLLVFPVEMVSINSFMQLERISLQWLTIADRALRSLTIINFIIIQRWLWQESSRCFQVALGCVKLYFRS